MVASAMMPPLRFVLCFGVMAGTLATQAQERAATTNGKTVWDGVYTAAQATRGQGQYETSCRSCHEEGPRRDEAFMRDWGGTPLDGLFSQIKASMPADAPASLSDSTYLDIVAYMLQVNSFPAGANELDANMIKSIRIEGKNGPEPVPNYALVQVAGCLAQGPDAAWMVSGAGEPVRTRNPAASTDEELQNSAGPASGAQTFRLLNVYPSPDAFKGHKVEAKGFLIRDPGGDRINVTSVRSLAGRCD